ncbi:membrane protein insertase YidC [Halocynthiibacter sp. C4]|uniref:membrane protein insertase YidC n=1 Tax=Halocynthiibacter sp. C4 TaxID=2992758 RepID=UPI00237A2DC5|nr:membrane protein insertase YidC [Halocynthiibacter sp. C4]MDE0588491.1 membrane protein insertase YidC [Halocynthiibacter sp. C4]
MDDQNKNLILAIALSLLVLLGWSFFVPQPEPIVDPNANAVAENDGGLTPPVADADGSSAPATVTEVEPASKAIEIPIETDRVIGSLSTLGGRIDNLSLKDYRETIEPDSALVTLLSPEDSDAPYYALYGWGPAGGLDPSLVPGRATIWSVEEGEKLSVDTPVTLVWDNGAGLIFKRKISIDADYMFSIEQSVTNTTDSAKRLYPYGMITQHGEPETIGFFILHEGVVRMSDEKLEEIKYKNIPDMDYSERENARVEPIDVTENGWVGFTGKYWMTTLIPGREQPFTSVAKYVDSHKVYTTESRLPVMDVTAGGTIAVSTQLFAGAKEWNLIRDYQNEGGVSGFLDSIDWGMFFFLTKPMFWLLHTLNGFIGNMGWSIIALTIIIKALLLPLAYKSYVSMAKMKKLQPEMEKIKERAGDDRQKLQTEMMALYKREKANPASGCLPILLQIPIFFSLYKVIFVTIELRHAPWIGWIRDLSAPDPSSILNLFGLLPFDAPDPSSLLAIISLGVLPIILGISMWLQQKLNPAPTEPTQAMVMAWMPWVFMFMLGNFASGLVLYWIANNTITFIQQYAIMRSQGIKPNVFENITSGMKKFRRNAK